MQFGCQAFIRKAVDGPAVTLFRSLADRALKVAPQPDFVAPSLYSGITQTRDWLSVDRYALAAVPVITRQEGVLLRACQTQMANELPPQCDAITEANRKAAITAKVEAGLDEETATEEVRARYEDGLLFDTDRLFLKDGTVHLIKDLRTKWKRGMAPIAIPDPDLGPDFGARTAASVIWGRKDPRGHRTRRRYPSSRWWPGYGP